MADVELNPEKIRRILVVRFSAIGDIILTLPVIDALHERFPEARIDYLTCDEYHDLVSRHPGVRRIWSFDRSLGYNELRRVGGLIAEQNYDLLLDLHKTLRSLYIRARAGAGVTLSYNKYTFARRMLELFRQNYLKNTPPVVDRYFTDLAAYGITRQGRRPRMRLSGRARERVSQILAENSIAAGDGFLVVAPGASHPTKRWPPALYARAAERMVRPGERVLVLGSGADRLAAEEVCRPLSDRALNLAGKLTLAESAAVIDRARLVLTNDSGLMHMADALDRPLVAVFGPTSRELGFYPLGPRARVVELPLPCRPCTLHGSEVCRLGHHRCLQELPVDAVVAAGEEARAAEAAPSGAPAGEAR